MPEEDRSIDGSSEDSLLVDVDSLEHPDLRMQWTWTELRRDANLETT